MTKEASYSIHIMWIWQLLYWFYIFPMHLYSSTRDFMTKHNTFFYHEVTFFQVEDKISILTLLQNLVKVVQAITKRSSIGEKIIHKHFHYLLNKIREDSSHTTFKSSSCITQHKWHSTISIRTIWTCECQLFLVFRMNSYLGKS